MNYVSSYYLVLWSILISAWKPIHDHLWMETVLIKIKIIINFFYRKRFFCYLRQNMKVRCKQMIVIALPLELGVWTVVKPNNFPKRVLKNAHQYQFPKTNRKSHSRSVQMLQRSTKRLLVANWNDCTFLLMNKLHCHSK